MNRHPGSARAMALAMALALSAGSCAHTPLKPSVFGAASLTAPDGAVRTFREIYAGAPFTVVLFMAEHCPVQTAHDGRLIEMASRYRARGVQVVGVDSEIGASAARVAGEVKAHGYPFPILADPGARLADALGATYSTYAVLVDRDGRVHYRGGLDSDITHLRADARLYLGNAIDAVLAGKEPETPEQEALGCALRKW